MSTYAFDSYWIKSDGKLRFLKCHSQTWQMHVLMSCVSIIGTLMGKSDLADLMTDIFGGVSVKLIGKTFSSER